MQKKKNLTKQWKRKSFQGVESQLNETWYEIIVYREILLLLFVFIVS